MPELRKDPVTGQWVIIRTERPHRPEDFRPPAPPPPTPAPCALCEGHEQATPPELLAYRAGGDGRANGPGWRVRVVPNKFPTLRVEGELERRGHGLYDLMNGVGAHELVVESPRHDDTLRDLPLAALEDVAHAFQERIIDLRRDTRFRSVVVFKPSRHLPDAVAAEMDQNLKPLVPRKGLAALSRSAVLAAAAIENLLSGVPAGLPNLSDGACALLVGTAFGHVESKKEFHRSARTEGTRLVSPIVFPNTIINSLAGHAAILFKITGPNSTVTSGRRSGLEAVLRAITLLDAGRASRAIVVGCEEVSPTLLRALGGRGGPAGEAAAAMLLEPGECVTPEGAGSAAGRILGGAERSSVRRGLRRAAAEAAAEALAESGLSGGDLGCILYSGSGGREELRPAESALEGLAPGAVPRIDLGGILGDAWGAGGAAAVVLATAAFAKRGLKPPAMVVCADPEGATCILVGG